MKFVKIFWWITFGKWSLGYCHLKTGIFAASVVLGIFLFVLCDSLSLSLIKAKQATIFITFAIAWLIINSLLAWLFSSSKRYPEDLD